MSSVSGGKVNLRVCAQHRGGGFFDGHAELKGLARAALVSAAPRQVGWEQSAAKMRADAASVPPGVCLVHNVEQGKQCLDLDNAADVEKLAGFLDVTPAVVELYGVTVRRNFLGLNEPADDSVWAAAERMRAQALSGVVNAIGFDGYISADGRGFPLGGVAGGDWTQSQVWNAAYLRWSVLVAVEAVRLRGLWSAAGAGVKLRMWIGDRVTGGELDSRLCADGSGLDRVPAWVMELMIKRAAKMARAGLIDGVDVLMGYSDLHGHCAWDGQDTTVAAMLRAV